MFKRSTRVMLAALAVMAFSATAFAADAPAKSEVKDLARVEVTGSRIAESIEDVPAQAYVVTKEEIDNSGARNVQEVLERIPGVGGLQSNSQSMAQDKTVTIRGLGMEVLLLVDGVPYMTSTYTAGNNAFDLRAIPMEDIERIEVVKGASSAVYGSAAAGGVINIITRKGAEKSSAMTKIESGSNGWFRGAVRGTAVGENGLKATLGYTKTRETGDVLTRLTSNETDAIWAKAKDYDANDYNFRLEKGAWSLTGDWGDFDSTWTYDGMYDQFQKNKYTRVALNYNDGENIGRIYYNKDEKEYSQPEGAMPWDLSHNNYETSVWGATFSRNQELWGQNIVYGLDFRSETATVEDFIAKKKQCDDIKRNEIAPYIETTVALGAINMDLGLRYEHWDIDNAEDADEFLPRVSFNYETESGKLIYATAGRFFMMPSFYQSSFDGWGKVANTKLDPEKGWTYDLGIKDMKAKNPWSLNAFYMDMEDKIDWNADNIATGGKIYSYINRDEYRAYGFEGQYKWNINDVWSVTPGVAYIHSEQRMSGKEWERTGMPRWDLSTFVNYVKGEWKGELGLHYYADRELNEAAIHPSLETGDIFTADIAFTWTPALLEGNIIRFACMNIFDEVYVLNNSNYVSPERRFVISWERQF